MQCCPCTTENLIADMLTENTGVQLMDSGGDDRRMWQQRQTALEPQRQTALEHCQAEPFVSWDDGGDGITVSTYHHLVSVLEVTERSAELDAELQALMKDSDEGYLTDIETFVETLVEDGRVDRRDVREVFNTYNAGEPVVQHIQGISFELDDQWYHVIQTHNGADVRGGYSTPHVFAEAPSDIESWAVQGVGEGVEIYCPNDKCQDDYGQGRRWTHSHEGIIFDGDSSADELNLYDVSKVQTPNGQRPACPHCGTALELDINRY